MGSGGGCWVACVVCSAEICVVVNRMVSVSIVLRILVV